MTVWRVGKMVAGEGDKFSGWRGGVKLAYVWYGQFLGRRDLRGGGSPG